jgi:alkaline phosphatase D
VVSVVSSSFFWPYPHMRSTSFQLNGPLHTPKDHPNEYQVGHASSLFSEDNFGRLDFRPNELAVTFYDRKGRQLSAEPVVHSL